nr:unnamed protein product [Callosobruchus analis]CAI5820076.1 unnamed protein product [Callosobruchus analis]
MFSLSRCCFQLNSTVWRFDNQKRRIHATIKLLTANSKYIERENRNFIPVYKFPYIRPLALVNRLSLYQIAATITSLPVAVLLNYNQIIGPGEVQLIAGLGITGCVTLLTAGFFTQKFIGFIYYNEEKNIVRIAYNDFWGRRKDIDIPATDIVPLSDLPATPIDGLYLTFRRFSTKETLKLNIGAGVILDKDKFNKIL